MTRRPWVATVVSVLLLLGLATPSLQLQLGQPDDSNRPAGDTMRIAYDRVADGFGVGFNGPLMVAIDLSGASNRPALLSRLASDLAAVDGVAAVAPAQTKTSGDAAVITVIPKTAPQSEKTSALVRTLRSSTLPTALEGSGAVAHVGGQTAVFDDLATKVQNSLLWLVLTVVSVSLVLLFFAFRSLWLPVISALMNSLSILAAYGVVTFVFQSTWGAQLLGLNPQPVVSFVPMLMFAILFGLSMDYNVFLLSAVREMKESGRSARDAVIEGIRRTGTLISTAGVIMTAVFIGFAFTSETEVRMIGIGLATAVIVDVTLVRTVLTPALLSLLGDRAWWLPSWLDKRMGRGLQLQH